MFKKILKSARNRILFNQFHPEIVLGYLRQTDNVFLKNTRISNTTSLVGEDHLDIKDHVFIGHFNLIDASNGLTIDEGCQITNHVSILTHSSHVSIRLYGKAYIKHKNRHIGYVVGQTIIGKYSFIGPHSVIMPGAKIGKGSIVNAYSYVKDSFPDFAIIAGNPAKVIGDTRRLDTPFLEQYPELKKHYNEWASDNVK